MSPTIYAENGFQFYFWSNERGEPPHVHVRKAEARAKWWLRPVAEARSDGFSPSQRRFIRSILEQRQQQLLWRWHATFDQEPR